MQEYFEHDEIWTPLFLKNMWNAFLKNELVYNFRLTNDNLNLNNFFIYSLALKYIFITAF